MIGLLRGEIFEVSEGGVVLLCGDVGYDLLVPAGVGCPPYLVGEQLTLNVITIVRQDAIVLCGFRNPTEKRIFNKLLGIQGIGPRLALAAIGTLGSDGLLEAAGSGNARKIQSVPGIGKKTAERVVLELRDKLGDLAPSGGVGGSSGANQVLVQALQTLGFKRAEIDDVLRVIVVRDDESDESIVKRALQHLNSARK